MKRTKAFDYIVSVKRLTWISNHIHELEHTLLFILKRKREREKERMVSFISSPFLSSHNICIIYFTYFGNAKENIWRLKQFFGIAIWIYTQLGVCVCMYQQTIKWAIKWNPTDNVLIAILLLINFRRKKTSRHCHCILYYYFFLFARHNQIECETM